MPEKINRAKLADLLSEAIAETVEKTTGHRPQTVDRDASLTSFGLDSLEMVNLVARMEEALGIELEPELAFNYPTINALADHISQSQETENAS
ncbi:MAG: acyl carrier protein [Pseudomonadota bacterium]